METLQLFSYGTLQHSDIQQSLFKRKLEGTADKILRYKLGTISIPENHPNAQTYFIAIYTGDEKDILDGICYTINASELSLIDDYEGPAYERATVISISGKEVLIYRKPMLPF